MLFHDNYLAAITNLSTELQYRESVCDKEEKVVNSVIQLLLTGLFC